MLNLTKINAESREQLEEQFCWKAVASRGSSEDGSGVNGII
jgi:hypothetical protein